MHKQEIETYNCLPLKCLLYNSMNTKTLFICISVVKPVECPNK